MFRKQSISVAAILTVTGLSVSSARAQIALPTVAIGNLGNTADSSGYGSVASSYNLGTTEVTNTQYAAFLNAVASTDTHNLYSTSMAGTFGGITRAGSAGSYTYAIVSGRADNPVNFVSFWDATRFANWLHNGQPTGAQNSSTTENGAYTLGGVTNPVNSTVTRNASWQWAVTSENEWYKAAYHQPASQGGDADDYWLYPTTSNTINTTQANYDNLIGNTVPVGSYAANFYGALDMGGNVWEWNEAVILDIDRGLRGGSFFNWDNTLRADNRNRYNPQSEDNLVGFRVVQLPAPNAAAVLAIGGLLSARRRR